MAWIKVKGVNGKISLIPQSVYDNQIKGSPLFTIVQEEKPKAIKESKNAGETNNVKVSKRKETEGTSDNQNTEKVEDK